MKKTKELEELCAEIGTYTPNWLQIMNRFMQNHYDGSSYLLSQYGKFFSEIYLDTMIESFARNHPEISTNLQPIEEGQKSKSFRFSYDREGRLKAIGINHTGNYEYDKVISINSLPVVFEIKLGRWHRGGCKNRASKGCLSTQEAIKYDSYIGKLYPIEELMKKQVGYVIIVPKIKNENNERGPYSNLFVANGGILVPFYTTRKQWKEGVKRECQNIGLKIKPE